MIPDEIVEKATRAAHETHCTPNCACVITLAMDRDIATAALSAVYADIEAEAQAEALLDVADLFKQSRVLWHGDGGVQIMCDRNDPNSLQGIDKWLRSRAAKLLEVTS